MDKILRWTVALFLDIRRDKCNGSVNEKKKKKVIHKDLPPLALRSCTICSHWSFDIPRVCLENSKNSSSSSAISTSISPTSWGCSSSSSSSTGLSSPSESSSESTPS